MTIQILTLKKSNITDFAKERNKMLKSAKSEWVLFLDQDEKINNLKFKITGKFSSYKIKRNTYFLGSFVGTDYPTRLVKKNSGSWVRRVHETWKTSAPVGVVESAFITHNTADSLSVYVSKINNYSTLHAGSNREEGKRSNLAKVIFFPMGKFFVTLVETRNVVFSIMQSLHSFLAWSKLYFLSS